MSEAPYISTKGLSTCTRCDTTAIKMATEQFENLTRKEIENFLCSFDSSCVLTMRYKQSGATYDEISFEMLIALFDIYFDDYLDILENNRDINFDYLLTLFERPAIYDLPHGEVLNKIESLKTKTERQKKLHKVFEKSVKLGEVELEKLKKE